MMDSYLYEGSYNEIGKRNKYIPGYISSKVRGIDTAPTIDPQQIFNYLKKSQPAPLWRIKTESKTFYTPKPISIILYRDDDLFFAENENLIVCGTGESPNEALQDFTLHVIHFFEYYKNIDDTKLTGDALRLKRLYENLLIEE